MARASKRHRRDRAEAFDLSIVRHDEADLQAPCRRSSMWLFRCDVTRSARTGANTSRADTVPSLTLAIDPRDALDSTIPRRHC
jgi:hypothetical protein